MPYIQIQMLATIGSTFRNHPLLLGAMVTTVATLTLWRVYLTLWRVLSPITFYGHRLNRRASAMIDRINAARCLANLGAPAVSPLAKFLFEYREKARGGGWDDAFSAVIESLGQIATPSCCEPIVDLLKASKPERNLQPYIERLALVVLGNTKTHLAIPTLEEYLLDVFQIPGYSARLWETAATSLQKLQYNPSHTDQLVAYYGITRNWEIIRNHGPKTIKPLVLLHRVQNEETKNKTRELLACMTAPAVREILRMITSGSTDRCNLGEHFYTDGGLLRYVLENGDTKAGLLIVADALDDTTWNNRELILSVVDPKYAYDPVLWTSILKTLTRGVNEFQTAIPPSIAILTRLDDRVLDPFKEYLEYAASVHDSIHFVVLCDVPSKRQVEAIIDHVVKGTPITVSFVFAVQEKNDACMVPKRGAHCQVRAGGRLLLPEIYESKAGCQNQRVE